MTVEQALTAVREELARTKAERPHGRGGNVPNRENNLRRTVLEQGLEDGIMTVHVLRDYPDVELPEHLTDTIIPLNLSWRYRPGDMVIDDAGIRVTLSFGGVWSAVSIPWGAVYVVTNHARTYAFSAAPGRPETAAAAPEKPKAKGGLRLV